jgi:hypothetical protein
MVDHIFTIKEIAAFFGEWSRTDDRKAAKWLARRIQPVLDKRLRLDRPYEKISQREWEGLIRVEGWLVAEAVEALIQSTSRFELLARMASRS